MGVENRDSDPKLLESIKQLNYLLCARSLFRGSLGRLFQPEHHSA